MPAKEFMTLLDVLQQEGTGSIKALDAVRSVGLASPEVTAFPVTVIDGTQYEINMPTGIPRFGFRPANAGAKNLTTEYTNKTVKCYYIDGPIAVDKAVVTSSARGAQLLTKETRSVTLGAIASIALQMWYRLPEQENVFPAISEQMGDYMTISADPSKQEDSEANRADNSGASAYLVILGDDFLHSIWGNKKTLSMSPVQEETVARNTEDGESGTMRAYTSRLEGWTGIAVESPFSVARIKNISAQHPLTDKLVAKAKSLFPAALRGMISYVVMNGNVKLLLQESRTLTPATGNGGTGMIAPEPDSVMGIKILEVDSLLDDESLSSVRAAFAEDFFRARRNSLALKN